MARLFAVVPTPSCPSGLGELLFHACQARCQVERESVVHCTEGLALCGPCVAHDAEVERLEVLEVVVSDPELLSSAAEVRAFGSRIEDAGAGTDSRGLLSGKSTAPKVSLRLSCPPGALILPDWESS